jgi:FKBP-type peptidyl-prolyl cis-trans isomerases 2
MAKKINPMLAIMGGLVTVLLLFAIISIVFYPAPAEYGDHGDGHGDYVDGHGSDVSDSDADSHNDSAENNADATDDTSNAADDDSSGDGSSANDNADSSDNTQADTEAANVTAAIGDTVSVQYTGKFENGDTVSVQYTGKFENGTVSDTSDYSGVQPVKVVLGQSTIFKEFDDAVLGMKAGETKTITVQQKASSNPDLVITFDRTQIIGVFGSVPSVNDEITFTNGNQVSKGTVQSVTANSVVIDFNSNTAVNVLTYEITVTEIQKAN